MKIHKFCLLKLNSVPPRVHAKLTIIFVINKETIHKYSYTLYTTGKYLMKIQF